MQVVEVYALAIALGVVYVVVSGINDEVVAVLVFDTGVADGRHTASESAVDIEEPDKCEFKRQQLVAMQVAVPTIAEASIESKTLEIVM